MSTVWSILKIIWTIIIHAPEIISLIKQIVDMIEQIKDNQARKAAWADLNSAAKKCREQGDTTEITKVFKKWVGRKSARIS